MLNIRLAAPFLSVFLLAACTNDDGSASETGAGGMDAALDAGDGGKPSDAAAEQDAKSAIGDASREQDPSSELDASADATAVDGATDAASPDATVDGGDPRPEHFAITQVGGGLGYSCALTAEGSVWCRGDGSIAGLGDGVTKARTSHSSRSGRSSWCKKLIAFASTTCAIGSDDELACWGGGSWVLSPVATTVFGFTGAAVDVALGVNSMG